MSALAKNNKNKRNRDIQSLTIDAQKPTPSTALPSSLPKQAEDLIRKGDYAGAANALASAKRDPIIRNTLGVCLMRAGYNDKAVDVFRSFVLVPGNTFERRDVSNASKRNFATSLLLKGFPSGALSVLLEMRDPDHPMTIRLYASIKAWEQTLSWFRWLDWKINGVEPGSCHISLDFEPGEFDVEAQLEKPVNPEKPQKSSLKLAA